MPAIIAAADKDGSGVIDPKEAEAVMGMMPQMIASHMHPQGDAMEKVMAPHDHAEYMEVQNRVRNEFKDAVLDLALKNNRNESLTKEECFGNCFHRCRWMLDPRTCVDTCNKGCGTDAELFDPMEVIAREQAPKFGETNETYTMAITKPGLKEGKLAVETRGQVLVVRGETLEQHKYYNITHQFLNTVRIPDDGIKDEITSELENETLTVTIPRDQEKKAELEAERQRLDQIARSAAREAEGEGEQIVKMATA